MEKYEKALKAFWCMYNTILAHNRTLSVYYETILIFGLVEAYPAKNIHTIGELKIETKTREVKVKWFWFLTKTIWEEYEVASGYVTNTNKGRRFKFEFYTPSKIEEIRQQIKEASDQVYANKDKEEEALLDEMLCPNEAV